MSHISARTSSRMREAAAPMAVNTRATTGLILALDARFAIAATGHRCPLYPRKRTKSRRAGMSALCHVWTAPELARLFFTFAGWSVQPCVRPVGAAHMTAGHNAFRGSGPGQKPAFEMHWHKWVVLIAGSTGSALRAVGPPNLHITP
jgi:hypothetical protein